MNLEQKKLFGIALEGEAKMLLEIGEAYRKLEETEYRVDRVIERLQKDIEELYEEPIRLAELDRQAHIARAEREGIKITSIFEFDRPLFLYMEPWRWMEITRRFKSLDELGKYKKEIKRLKEEYPLLRERIRSNWRDSEVREALSKYLERVKEIAEKCESIIGEYPYLILEEILGSEG